MDRYYRLIEQPAESAVTSANILVPHLHLTLATTPEGLLRCGLGLADPERGGKPQCWLDGYCDLAAAAKELTRRAWLVAVMDREAEFFALFDEQRRCGRVDLPVRAQHDRCLEGPDRKLFTPWPPVPPLAAWRSGSRA